MRKSILWLIRLYQMIFSIPLRFLSFQSGGCRFTPSCSEYTYQAVAKYGIVKGLFLGVKRILRCY